MNRRGEPLRITPYTRTPCCSRIPCWLGDRRYFCRGCGTVYVDAASLVWRAFGVGHDVTSMTPARYRP